MPAKRSISGEEAAVDDDQRGNAWQTSPSVYLGRRPAQYSVSAPRAHYVKMRDGCRLAADVYLPAGADAHARWPTIAVFTPYYRRFRLKAGANDVEAAPGAFRYRDTFVPRGYALVVVDVRGTGASFGCRDSFRSPAEREDYREVADWIVAQPWSNGAIGSTGISYVGAAADFLASTGHPAVKAIAPLFAVWDTYGDHYYPGGILLNRLVETYDALMVALDHDRRDLIKNFSYFSNPAFEGPQPVDEDRDGEAVQAAVREHLANFRMADFVTDFKFKDDTLPYAPDFSSASFSPYHYMAGVAPEVAVYSVSGWMDGAGYANGAIARFLTLPNAKRHLLLGPWDHGARINVSPWRGAVEPQFMVLAEVLRFFDEYLAGRDTGLRAEAPIHYFTMHEEAWRAAQSWPPVGSTATLHLDRGGTLSAAAPAAGADTYQVDFGRGTGTKTRYERLGAADTREYYPDWQGRDAGMLCYTSAALPAAAEFSGHAIVSLEVSASEPDAALFVYLSEVEPADTVRYVTEGVLRALHRREQPCPPFHQTAWPYHSLARADAVAMPIDQPQRIRFALLPTSWRFSAGSRIRLAIAGADADHYAQIPHGRPPRLVVHRGPDGSHLELPLRSATR